MMRVILVLLLVISLTASGQKFQGKATYKTHRNIDIKIQEGGGAPNSEIQKALHEQLKKRFQKTYTLSFTKSKSTYVQNKEIQPNVKKGDVKIMIMGNGAGDDVLYKNISTKGYVNKREISGKRFLIKDKLPIHNWKMSSETKKIGKYTCYKATRSREVEKSSFMMTDGETEEKKKKIIITTTAWYTPEIPISNGPGMHWGLPGLILEVHEGKQSIVCSELIVNPSKKIKITIPKKGKKVTQEKFDKIMKEKSEEMIERFKNNRKSTNGGSLDIQIQG